MFTVKLHTNTWSTDQRKKLSEQILKCYAKSTGQATSSKYVFFAIVFKTQSDNLLSQYFMLLLLAFVLSEVIMGFLWGLATSVMALTVRSVTRWRDIRLMRGLKYDILSSLTRKRGDTLCLQLRTTTTCERISTYECLSLNLAQYSLMMESYSGVTLPQASPQIQSAIRWLHYLLHLQPPYI